MNEVAVGTDGGTSTSTSISNTDLLLSSWLDVTQKAAALFDTKKRVETFWDAGTRSDGRLFLETRTMKIQRGVLTKPHAYGSALITRMTSPQSTCGALVIAAVTLMVGQPTTTTTTQASSSSFSSIPTSTSTNYDVLTAGDPGSNNTSSSSSCGDIVVTVSTNQTTKNSTIDTAAVQSFLQRILCEQNINLHQLCIVPNQSAFRLLLNINIIHNDGNILDICLLAAIAALTDTDIPTIQSLKIHNGRVYIPDCDTYGGSSSPDNDTHSTNGLVPSSQSYSLHSPTSQYTKFRMPIVPVAVSAGIINRSFPTSRKEEDDDNNINNDIDDDDEQDNNNRSNDNQATHPQQYWIIDPSYEEEIALHGYFTTIVVDGAAAAVAGAVASVNKNIHHNDPDATTIDDHDDTILAIDMSSSQSSTTPNIPLSMTDVALLMKIASARASDVYQLLYKQQ